jgi:glycosyltransferase involved in cell wall biosynthesis
MRVLFKSGSGEMGGAERSLLDIVWSLRHAEPAWPLHLVTPADGPLLGEALALGARAVALPIGSALARIGEPANERATNGRAELLARLVRGVAPLADYRRRLRAHIREVSPDIVHTHGLKAHLFASWSNPGLAAVVWHLHDYVGRRAATASLLRHSLARCRAIIANSRSVADDARAVLDGRVPIVPVLNAVDLARFSPEGACADLDTLAGACDGPTAETGAPGAVRVGLLGTFAKWKGHTTFLDACARLPRALGVHAYVIGGSVYHTDNSQVTLADLQAHAAAAGLTGRVTFCGVVPAADPVLRALDIVVHASTDPEPFGLVIAEAMACGRAVIAADAGGARELVTPGIDALVHTPGEAASLAARINELAADAGLRTRLGAAARATALRRFDRARLAAEILPVFRRAVAAKGRA